MIKAYNLNKYYNKGKQNEIHVINDVSLSLPDTGLVTFLGQSGSGKTTLLNILGGLDKATGVIEYDDQTLKKYSISKIDKIRREKIGYIFQNYNLLLDRTVLDNLKIALSVLNITDKEEVEKRCEYALKKVGLFKYRKKLASCLSGGQMQRVSIARCLVKNSKIIIADEPTGNLDSNNSIEIMNILKKISSTTLVLLVTHDKNLAEYFSDRIIEIKDGKIIKVRESDKDQANLQANSNHIYLKDMKKVEKNEATYYFESNEEKEIKFEVIEHGNVFYLKSNCKIKILEESPLEVIDDTCENHKVNDEFTFDTSWYQDKKQTNQFNNFLKLFKGELINFFISSKKTKFFYAALLLIGVIVGFINISYSSYTAVNTSSISYDNDVYKISSSANPGKEIQVLKEAKDKGLIESYYNTSEEYLYLNYYKNSYETKAFTLTTYIFDSNLISSYNIIEGRKALYQNEVVISKSLAKSIMKEIGPDATYESVFSCVSSYGTNIQIVGVIDKESSCLYANSQAQTSGDNFSNYTLFTTNKYEELSSFLRDNSMEMDTIYNCVYSSLKQDNQDSKYILVPVILVLIAITLVYIYFSMRSKMINDIYTIGVFRAIGYSRSKITLKYGIEIFIMTLFTTLLGYLAVCIAYARIVGKLVKLGGNGVDIIHSYSTYTIGVLIFVISIVIGLLPITLLLRKTPSEILSKYDI